MAIENSPRRVEYAPFLRISMTLCALVVLFLGGCSEDASTDRCEGVTCEIGTCDPGTGECQTPSCQARVDCPVGFGCTEGQCTPDAPCEEQTDCERGVCVEGGCINAEICTQKSSCLLDHDCVDGECVFDACTDVTCERGVCEAATGNCVNNEFCTSETEFDNCLEGFYCYGQVCSPPEEVCEGVTCERGVCEASIQGCTNAPSCAEDTDCLEDFFCDEGNECAPNVCDSNFIRCARGVCEISTGDCLNAEVCTAPQECTDGFSCIGGDCIAAGDECGEDGCPGNRVCQVDDDTLSASCEENPNGCFRALDCDAPGVCRDGDCVPPQPCAPDPYEPNNVDGEATDFLSSSTANSLDGAVCADDIDVFTYDTAADPEFTGTLVVDLQPFNEDIGLGGLSLELVDPDGTVIGSEQGDQERLRIEYNVGALDQGVYTIRVAEADLDMNGQGDVSTAGVRYGLFVDLMERGLADACPMAPLLGTSVESGNSLSGASFQFGSTCTAPDNSAGEDIWRFEVSEASFVTLRVTPTSDGGSLTFSVRERCESLTSEFYCIDGPNRGSQLQFQEVLAPGSYYVLVQGRTAGTGESYDIQLSQSPVVCGPADSVCLDPNTSRFCNASRTSFETENCSEGCNMDDGLCTRLESDICRTAIDASGGYSGTIDWGSLTNDYDPGPGGCVPDNSGTQTDGPDAAFFVNVPADSVLDVNLDRESGDYVSLYLTDDCKRLDARCILGVNDGLFDDERLQWVNDTGVDQALYVIADNEDTFSYSTATINIAIQPKICTPNTSTCTAQGEVESCNAFGTQQSTEPCTFGCASGACNPVTNNQCSSPVDLLAEPNQTFTGYIDEYTGSVDPGFSGCTGSSARGPEAYFTLTGNDGDVATVTLDGAYNVSLWVTTDCADAADQCIVGSDAGSSSTEQIQWVIDSTQTYTVVADSRSSFSASGEFTVSANVQAPSCTPGALLGCNGSTLEYCSEFGIPVGYACSTTCTGSLCDDPTGEVCVDPIVLTDGMTVSGDFSGINALDPGEGLVGSCSIPRFDAPEGSDTVYAVDLQTGQYLLADYTATTSSAIAYVLTDCSDELSCVAVSDEGTRGEIRYQASQDERVYLIMDRTSTSTSGSYDISVQVRFPDCTPGVTSPSCQGDGVTLDFCDGYGFTQQYTCPMNCAGASCVDPTGDVCPEAIPVLSGDTVTGDFDNLTNSIETQAPLDGQCRVDSGNEPDGPETIYAIELFAGEVLDLNLITTYTNAMIYILETCEDRSSCVAGELTRGPQRLTYQATSTGRHYIVVDGSISFGDSAMYTLEINTIPGAICAPDTTRCDVTGSTVEFCDATGTVIEQSYTCPMGCSFGSCDPVPTADSCSTATYVGSGTYIVDSYLSYTDDHDMTTSSCVGDDTPGPDSFYTVDVVAGEVLHVVAQSLASEDPSVYIFRNCLDIEGSCIAGADADADDRSELYYLATTTETLTIGVDNEFSTADEPYELLIETLPQVCQRGQTTCAIDGASLDICNEFGVFESLRCPSGSCSGGTCDNPTGELCFDAIPIFDGFSFNGDFSDFSNDINPGFGPGSCYLDSAMDPSGSDTVFSVNLAAGDKLTANLTTGSSSATLYVLDSCTSSPDEACVESSPAEKFLEYTAGTAGLYYLVVDSDSSFDGASWTLDVDIDSGFVCTPNSSSCENGIVTVCSSDGRSVLTQSTCSNGCYNRLACAAVATAPDTCANAAQVTDSITFVDTYDRFNDDYNLSSASCVGNSTPGPEAIYQVAMPANTILFVDVRAGYEFDDPAVYVFTDCADAEGTCLAGDHNSSDKVGVTYTSTSSETVYVAVDSDNSFDRDRYEVDFRFRPVECTMGQTRCSGDDLQTCNSIGLFETTSCSFGCSSGACNPPTNDLCSGAIDVSAGGQFTTPIFEYANDYDPTGPMGTVDSCTGDSAPGPDAVYSISLDAGDFVELTMTMESADDPSLWVSDSCADALDAANSCVIGIDEFGNQEKIQFLAPAPGTYFIFADVDDAGTVTGDMTLEVNIYPAGTCTPGAVSCSDPDTVLYCDDGGTREVTATCDGGCSAGVCGAPTGEACYDPIDVTAGGNFMIDMDSKTDDYELPENGCVLNDTPGNDAVLFADVTAGDLLHVSVDGPSGANPALYLTDDCSLLRDGLNTGCVQGHNRDGTSDELVFRPTTSGRYTVVLDATSTGLDGGQWNVNVTNGTPFCVPGTTTCLDTTTLNWCEPNGTGFISQACVGGCMNDACATPEGEVCGDAVALTSGVAVSGDFGGVNTVDLGQGRMGECLLADAQPGVDTTYYIDLLAGQTLDVSYTSTSSFALMYVTTDCADAQACKDAGADRGQSGSASYTAPADERVYVVMDRAISSSNSASTYSLTATVQ